MKITATRSVWDSYLDRFLLLLSSWDFNACPPQKSSAYSCSSPSHPAKQCCAFWAYQRWFSCWCPRGWALASRHSSIACSRTATRLCSRVFCGSSSRYRRWKTLSWRQHDGSRAGAARRRQSDAPKLPSEWLLQRYSCQPKMNPV